MTKPACFSDTCAPPTGRALEARIFDQPAREMALRALKGAARAREIQRLLFPAAARKIIHFGTDFTRIPRFQHTFRLNDHPIRMLLINACTVSKALFRAREHPGFRPRHP